MRVKIGQTFSYLLSSSVIIGVLDLSLYFMVHFEVFFLSESARKDSFHISLHLRVGQDHLAACL